MSVRTCAATAAVLAAALCPGVASAQTQEVTGSTGAAQVGAVQPVVNVAANVPVTANAPVTVASPHSGGDATQTGHTSATSSGGHSAAVPTQDTNGSAAVAQIGSVNGATNAAADAPVTANAPISVASPHSGGDAKHTGASHAAAGHPGSSSSGHGSSDSRANQHTSGSTGSAQVGAVGLTPAVAATAPATINAPVTIASPDSGGNATQTGDSSASAAGSVASGSGDETTGGSPPTDEPNGTTPTTGGTGPSPSTGGSTTGPESGGPTTGSEAGGPTTGSEAGGPTTGSGAGGGPAPARGELGAFARNPSPSTSASVRREVGALAGGGLPFTGLLLWALAVIGVLALAAGTTGRRVSAVR